MYYSLTHIFEHNNPFLMDSILLNHSTGQAWRSSGSNQSNTPTRVRMSCRSKSVRKSRRTRRHSWYQIWQIPGIRAHTLFLSPILSNNSFRLRESSHSVHCWFAWFGVKLSHVAILAKAAATEYSQSLIIYILGVLFWIHCHSPRNLYLQTKSSNNIK